MFVIRVAISSEKDNKADTVILPVELTVAREGDDLIMLFEAWIIQ
jgi:hypothetical protein